MDQLGTWHGGRPRPRQHGEGDTTPIFGPCLLWPNGWMDQDGTWHGGRPRPRPLCARWRPSSTPKGHSPQFPAHVCCGQTAGWIKMPLGMEVGLGLRDIVFDVDPATFRKKGTPTPTEFLAHVYCGQMAGWRRRRLYGSRPRLRPHCTTLGPRSR